MSNLKAIGLAVMQYAEDADGKLPSVAAKGAVYGWADALYPYHKPSNHYQCSAEPDYGQDDPRLSGYTDYWFNAQLSDRRNESLGNTSQLIMAGDGNDGTDLTDARYAISALPTRWISAPKSPLYRHLKYANYLFADGHAKMMEPSRISTIWKPNHYFFTPSKP